ncbi:MAG: TIGR03960 family B12-binding radical SAM protein [Candidatus Aminicenantia bacterium]
MNIDKELWKILRRVEKPSRYIGHEWNEIKKDPTKVKTKVALIFPDAYEVGMSYLGQKILYFILNQRSDILAERVFAPWTDFEREIRSRGIPLFSLENRIPLKEFDILGFSLLYELNYSNVLNILNLGYIPLKSSKRDMNYPLVIAGGPASFNPEPLADFIDLYLIGDGEEAFLELIDKYQELKNKVKNKIEVLKALAEIKGTYVPSFYIPYLPVNSSLLAVKPKDSFPDKIEKRIALDLNQYPFPEKIVVPSTEIIFDRVSMEISRGCPQRCRFCQAASIYSPFRVRNPNKVIENTLNSLDVTGYEDASLTTLSPTDYPYLEETTKILMDSFTAQKISLSLSALRPVGLSEEIIQNIKRVRKTGFTLAPEAGTERLRKVINKNLCEEEILDTASKAFSLGWRILKLYFMLGLPTEGREDLEGIIDLVKKLFNLGRKKLGVYPTINLSLTSFIPKPHTSFQWMAMEQEEVLKEKFKFIKQNLKRYSFIKFKDHSVKMSIIEVVFSRGDRRLNQALELAWQKGARFDSWKDKFNYQIWEEAFTQSGINRDIYLSTISKKAILPWEHIETGFTKSYLLQEMKKSFQEERTPSCLENKCGLCQGCNFWAMFKKEFKEKIEIPKRKVDYLGEKKEKIIHYRAIYAKLNEARFCSHLDLIHIIERAFRRAKISVLFSQGFHPKVVISYSPALPLGMEGKNEVLEFKSEYLFKEKEFLDKINKFLPSGIRFLSLKKIVQYQGKLPHIIKGFRYSLQLDDEEVKKAIEKIKQEKQWNFLSDLEVHQKIIDQMSSENELLENVYLSQEENKIYFQVKFKPEKPLRIQEIIAKYYQLENPVYLISRKEILLLN